MPDVFISYSRKDTDFVRRLFDELKARGRDAWVDWQGIDYSSKWWEEICAGIEGSDNFILIISPDTLNSVYCHREIAHARQHHKRIIPMIYRSLNEKEVVGGWYTLTDMRPHETMARANWEAIKTIQWIDYPQLGNLDQAVAALLETVDTDPERVRVHTRLLLRLRDWENRGRSPSALLRGDELASYEAWLAETDAAGDEPRVTDEQRTYIAASRSAEDEEHRHDLEQENRIRQSSRATFGLAVAVVAIIIAAAVIGTRLSSQAEESNNLAATATVAQGQAFAAGATAAAEATEADLQVATAAAELATLAPRVDSQRLITLANQILADPNSPNEPALLLLVRALSLDDTSEAGRALFHQAVQLPYSIRGLSHPAPIRSAVYSADGRLILTACDDGYVRLWGADSGELLRWYQTPSGSAAQTVAISPDGSLVAAGDWFGQITLWDTDTGDVSQIFDHAPIVNTVMFSPDGATLLSTSDDRTAHIWDIETGRRSQTFEADASIRSGVFSRDGRYVLTGDYANLAILWDIASGERLQTLSHPDRIYVVALSPDGRYILTGSRDGSARLWSATSGDLLRVVAVHAGGVIGLAFSSDGHLIATGGNDSRAQIWDTTTGALLSTLEGYRSGVESIMFSPDSRLLLTANNAPDNAARVWPVQPTLVHVLRGHVGAVRTAAFSPDGTKILTAGADGMVRVWDAVTLEPLHTFHVGVTANGTTFSPDGRYIAAGSPALPYQPAMIWVWEVESGALLRSFPFAEQPSVIDIAFTSNGQLLASSYWPYGCVWQLQSDGTQPCMSWQDEIDNTTGSEDSFHPVAVSPDNRWVAAAFVNRITIRSLNASVAETQHALSADRQITSLVFSGDGRYLLASDWDGIAHLWDTTTWQESLTLSTGRGERLSSAAFSPDDRFVLTAASDQTARLWSLETGTLVQTYYGHTESLFNAAFSPDGLRVITSSADGTAIIHPLTDAILIDSLCQQLNRDFTEIEHKQFGLEENTPPCPGTNEASALPQAFITPAAEPDLSLTPINPNPLVTPLPTATLAPTMPPVEVKVASLATVTLPAPTWTQLPTLPATTTPTPTATPLPAGEASIGQNGGSFPIGGIQSWQYAGQAGEVLTLRVQSANPANSASDEERITKGLLDSLLIVRSSDGSVLAENDDIDPAVLTDSLIEGLMLPAAGSYTIEVRSYADESGGAYTLVIESSRTVTVSPTATLSD